MFRIKVVQKIETHVLCSVTFFQNSCSLRDNVEKYGTAGQAIDSNMVQLDRPQMTIQYGARSSVRCIPKATYRHSEYVIVIAFPRQQRYANVPQCYVYAQITCLVPSDTRNM